MLMSEINKSSHLSFRTRLLLLLFLEVITSTWTILKLLLRPCLTSSRWKCSHNRRSRQLLPPPSYDRWFEECHHLSMQLIYSWLLQLQFVILDVMSWKWNCIGNCHSFENKIFFALKLYCKSELLIFQTVGRFLFGQKGLRTYCIQFLVMVLVFLLWFMR